MMKSKILVLLASVIVLSAAGCASAPGPQYVLFDPYHPVSVVGEQPYLQPRDIRHTVGPAETLWRISKTYGVDVPTLLAANGLHDPTHIQNGQIILIPDTRGPRPLIPLYPNWKWTHIVVHHTATDHGDAHSIDVLHHKRGFDNGLGYHFLINNGTNGKADGQIEVGPRWIKQMNGAHANANGMNEHGIGIALVGNFSGKKVSATEMESLIFLVSILQQYYRIPDENVIGHRNVPGKVTECPGLKFPWRAFKQRLETERAQLNARAYTSAPSSSKRISRSDSWYPPRVLMRS